MRQASGNPRGNQLQGGVTESSLQAAIAKSGYPMQAAVVAAIEEAAEAQWSEGREARVRVQEEWTYVDRDTDDVRAIDALADVHLWTAHLARQPRIRPVLSLLVECKQSELPHVFFTRADQYRPQFPTTTGFPHREVTLQTDDDVSSYTFDITNLWGLDGHEFITGPPVAVSLSKARRKGGHLEVSGEDTYKGLTLALLKAVDHLEKVAGYARSHYTDGRLVVPVAVIRGPMIAVLGDGQGDLEAVPWVRVQRYEPEVQPEHWRSHRLLAYDVVHEDFLPTYLASLHDYTDQFAKAVAEHQEVLLTGRGFATGLGGWAHPVDVIPLKAQAQAVVRRTRIRHLRSLVGDLSSAAAARFRSAKSRFG